MNAWSQGMIDGIAKELLGRNGGRSQSIDLGLLHLLQWCRRVSETCGIAWMA
jgi:hypothetical protein